MDAIFPVILITVTVVGFIYIARMLRGNRETPAQDSQSMLLLQNQINELTYSHRLIVLFPIYTALESSCESGHEQ